MSDFREFWKKPNYKDRKTVLRGSLHITNVELEFLSELLLEWLDDEPDAITAESFYWAKKIPSSTWYDWLKKSQDLREAFEVAVEIIGERRERRGLTGEFNAQLVALSLPAYSKRLRDWKLQERKSNEDSIKQTIVVIRDKMPDTDEVMPRHAEGNE
jgi:hypothetical protein